MTSVTLWLWIGFIAFLLLMLVLDLGVFNRRARAISIQEALGWTAFWTSLAIAFVAAVYYLYDHDWLGIASAVGHASDGKQAALEFFTGWLIEKSLSVDNIFVFAVVFAYFRVSPDYQHRVLFWGVFGALLLRGVMIAAGVSLIQRFSFMNFIFGGLLLVTAARLLVARHDNLEPDKNLLVRLARWWFPVTPTFHGERFFVRQNGRWAATPLFLVLLVVEGSDVVFAVDSIPAIFAVTRDPFLVFTSNAFAILGLRSLYFALAGMMERFRYLKMSLVFLLVFVGMKMILNDYFHMPVWVSLAVIGGILSVGTLASVAASKYDTARLASPLAPPDRPAAPVGSVQGWFAFSLRQARRVVVLVVGSSVLLVGLAMVVLPGPAVVVIPMGLGILAWEFQWARRWLKKVRDMAVSTVSRNKSGEGGKPDGSSGSGRD